MPPRTRTATHATCRTAADHHGMNPALPNANCQLLLSADLVRRMGVRRHGGLFDEFLRSPSSAQPSTHLLTATRTAMASTASDGKLKAARRWGVAVVSLAWLTDAVRDGRPTDPELYAVR